MPPYYSDEEEEIDIRFRRGRVSPAPIRYIDPVARERLERQERLDRAAYYQAATGARLLPNRSGSHHRSRSHTRQSLGPVGAPVIINNHVDNYYEEDVRLEEEPRYRYPQLMPAQVLAPPVRPHRSHSHSRRRSRSSSSSSSKERHERYELELARKELEKLKLKEKEEKERKERAEMERKAVEEWKRREEKEKKDRAEAEKRAIEEWKRREEREAKEKKERAEAEKKAIEEWKKREEKEKKEKAEAEQKAIEEWKRKEEEKKAKEKKAKEEEDKKYKERIEEDMRKAGMTDHQIAAVLKKDHAKHQQMVVPERPTYTRMARRHISIETLRTHHIDFELDVDPEFVIIKRWVPEYEQDFLWGHTRQIREVRGAHHHHHPQQQLQIVAPPAHSGVVVVDDPPRRRRSRSEDRMEFVRRKHSPHPLLTFFAGGRR